MLSIPITIFSCITATPIQRAKDLVQENQALLGSLPPKTHDGGPSTNPKPFSQVTEACKVHQPVHHTPHNRRGRRGGRAGKGGHQDLPQSRRPTLLEMVKRNFFLNCTPYRIYKVLNVKIPTIKISEATIISWVIM